MGCTYNDSRSKIVLLSLCDGDSKQLGGWIDFPDGHIENCFSRKLLITTGVILGILAFVVSSRAMDRAATRAADATWVRTWSASPMPDVTRPGIRLMGSIKAQTLRQRLRISAGGRQIRIQLSNEFGTQPLLIGATSVVIVGTDAESKFGTSQQINFGGGPSAIIGPGATTLSDPIDLGVAARSEIVVSIFIPTEAPRVFFHQAEFSNGYLSADGDYTRKENGVGGTDVVIVRPILTGVDVAVRERTQVLVALGDSITAAGWPSLLADRLDSDGKGRSAVSVVNAGIGGNRLLRDGIGQSATARFERDALSIPGVTHIIVLEGTNDLGEPGRIFDGVLLAPLSDEPRVVDLVTGYQQLIERAHKRALKIYGGTIPPFKGSAGYTAARDEVRNEVNAWIRTKSEFDAVLDFDAVLRTPDEPDRLRSAYDSGDHLHPNSTGLKAMADAIDLALFK